MRAFSIKCSDIAQCPDLSLAVRHYREDGSCLHHPPRTVAEERHDEPRPDPAGPNQGKD